MRPIRPRARSAFSLSGNLVIAKKSYGPISAYHLSRTPCSFSMILVIFSKCSGASGNFSLPSGVSSKKLTYVNICHLLCRFRGHAARERPQRHLRRPRSGLPGTTEPPLGSWDGAHAGESQRHARDPDPRGRRVLAAADDGLPVALDFPGGVRHVDGV